MTRADLPLGAPGPTWGGSAAPPRVSVGTEAHPATLGGELRPASFRRRFVGTVLDLVIVGILFVVLRAIALGIAGVDLEDESDGDTADRILLVVFVGSLAYFWIWNSVGFSPGKQALGLKIVNVDGAAPGWGGGFARTAGLLLSFSMTFGLGYLWALWDQYERLPLARGRGQTWHDKIAGTFVVYA